MLIADEMQPWQPGPCQLSLTAHAGWLPLLSDPSSFPSVAQAKAELRNLLFLKPPVLPASFHWGGLAIVCPLPDSYSGPWAQEAGLVSLPILSFERATT